MQTTTEPTNEERIDELFLSTLRTEELEAIHGGVHYNRPDADGYVPEYYGRWGGRWLGYTATYAGNQRAIFYDTYNMRNAGPNDWAHVRAHERAHARGWDHGQGTPCQNAAFNPYYRITGR
jgi:hypothetical protein